MSVSIGAAASGGTYALPFRLVGQAQSARTPEAAQQTAKTDAKIAVAQQALANANSIVDQDKRNHSPGCVACDQKLVDKAQGQVTQAKASASDQTAQTSLAPGSKVDFTA